MLERYGRNGGLVHWEGCGVPQNGTPGILFISTIDPLQPPRATVHPPSTSSSLHQRLFIHGLLFFQPPPLLHRPLFNQPSPRGPVQPPLHGLLFIQPSFGYCSTSPPRGRPIHPALHGVLFIHPSTGSIDRGTVHPAGTASTTTGSCSSNPPPGTVHPTPHRELFIQTPQPRSLFTQRQHRSASVSSSSEGITRV